MSEACGTNIEDLAVQRGRRTLRIVGKGGKPARGYDRDHAALAVLLGLNGLRVSEACGTNIEDLAVQFRTSHIAHRGQGQQAGHDPARAAHRPDHSYHGSGWRLPAP